MQSTNANIGDDFERQMPRTSSEMARAILLFAIFLGMVGLASLPEGLSRTLLFFVARNDTEGEAVSHEATEMPQKVASSVEVKAETTAAVFPEQQSAFQTVRAIPAGGEGQEVPGYGDRSVFTANLPAQFSQSSNISAQFTGSQNQPAQFAAMSSDSPQFVQSLDIPSSANRLSAATGAWAESNAMDDGLRGEPSGAVGVAGGPGPRWDDVAGGGFNAASYRPGYVPESAAPVAPVLPDSDNVSRPATERVTPLTAEQAGSNATTSNANLEGYESQLRAMGAVRYRLERWGEEGQLFRFWCETPLAPGSTATAFWEAISSRPEEAMADVIRQILFRQGGVQPR